MDKFDLKKYISEGILNEDETSFSPEQIKILDSKISSRLRDSIYSSLDDIYNTNEKKEELFNQTIDRVDNVISGYSSLIPSTGLEKKLFLVKLGQGSRADNIGPGELFVVLATKDTTFGTVGDVNSSGEEIEIKRSTSTELNITYTAGGIFKFFPILQDLNGLVSGLRIIVRKYAPDSNLLSRNSRLLLLYLGKGFYQLKVDPKQGGFDGKPIEDAYEKYSSLFNLKKDDFIENDIDRDFINDITNKIEEYISLLNPELFKEGFKTALKTYFGKGFDYILFYKKLQPFLLKVDGIEEDVDVYSSTIRNGYQIYIRLKKSSLTIVANPEQLDEAEKYSIGQKINMGYGLTAPLVTHIYDGLNKLLSILK
tara:strand:+ start:68 stop:1171 length:1104 start_codon:yes stop_codon:yes gene_type:complete